MLPLITVVSLLLLARWFGIEDRYLVMGKMYHEYVPRFEVDL
jgi:hypothetical protein